MVTCTQLRLDRSASETDSDTSDRSGGVELEWISPQSHTRWSLFFYVLFLRIYKCWSPFIHDGWVYTDATKLKVLIYIYTTIDFEKEHTQRLLTSFEVDVNNSVTCLHRTPVFDWYWLGVAPRTYIKGTLYNMTWGPVTVENLKSLIYGSSHFKLVH